MKEGVVYMLTMTSDSVAWKSLIFVATGTNNGERKKKNMPICINIQNSPSVCGKDYSQPRVLY